MKKIFLQSSLVLAMLFFAGLTVNAQSNASKSSMKTYLIERNVPGIGKWTPQQLKELSHASCDVLKGMDSKKIQWVHSYVTDNNLFCVYKAENEELVREHAKKGNFPVTSIKEVEGMISPATAN